MIVTPEKNRLNRSIAVVATALVAVGGSFLSWTLLNDVHRVIYAGVPLSVVLGLFTYWFLRRKCLRRLKVMKRGFPDEWERILRSHVAIFNCMKEPERERFRQLTKLFLNEIRITGIQAEVDDVCRVLVAASAVIPVFGFPDWEYVRLGEVLIYPNSFGANFQVGRSDDSNIVGMVGTGQQSGVMILSKPDLIAGFVNADDKRNVGIHEFAHLVDKADGEVDGIPAGIPKEVLEPWARKISDFLNGEISRRRDIDAYGLTNSAEFFAVVTEYFFESPSVMARKRPELYELLRRIFRQDMKSRLKSAIKSMFPTSSNRARRNSPCPCGSGKKYKKCCRRLRN